MSDKVIEIKPEDVKVIRTEADVQGEYTQSCMKSGDLEFKEKIDQEDFEKRKLSYQEQHIIYFEEKKKLGLELQAIRAAQAEVAEVSPNETH